MHDDIGAGLTRITLISELGKMRNGNKNTGQLQEIAETSRQLVSNMSEIIWSLHPESKTLEQLLSHLREQLHKLLEFSGMDYKIILPDYTGDFVLTYEQRRNIMLFMKEMVNNAIKHGRAKKIEIVLSLNDNLLAGMVKDDGIGFEIELVKSGQGTANIKSRIYSLGGNVQFNSSPMSGTTISFQIPLLKITT
jgi:signal transduction histidine kinase